MDSCIIYLILFERFERFVREFLFVQCCLIDTIQLDRDALEPSITRSTSSVKMVLILNLLNRVGLNLKPGSDVVFGLAIQIRHEAHI